MNKEKVVNRIKGFFESKVFKITVYVLCTFFILFFVFQAGMITGFNRASFGHNWGDNYDKNFGSPRRNPPLIKNNIKEMPNSHGAVGKIIKIDFPNIVVLDRDQTEKVIVITDKTNIIERKEKVNKENLSVDKFIVLIGNPNNEGQIEAKLIRIIPSPEDMIKNSSPSSGDLPGEFNDKNI